MSHDLQLIATTKLQEAKRECEDVIRRICEHIRGSSDASSLLQQLVVADDMVATFRSQMQSDAWTSEQALRAAVAVLANAVSISGIDDELLRRASSGN